MPACTRCQSVVEKFLQKNKPEHAYKAGYILDKYLGKFVRTRVLSCCILVNLAGC